MSDLNNQYGISSKSFNTLIEYFSKQNEIDKVIIFGSRALGNAKSGSDIDLAVFGDCLSFEILQKLKSELNEHSNIPYYIDIISFETIENKELKEHILTFGKSLFVRTNK